LLLEQFGLTDAADRAAKTYSGGMQRRLDLAASLVGRPKVLFLDEPTTGLDPRSRPVAGAAAIGQPRTWKGRHHDRGRGDDQRARRPPSPAWARGSAGR
jgi:hypothetical protein